MSEVFPENYAKENPIVCFSLWYRTTGTSTDLRIVDVNSAFGQQELWRSPSTPSKLKATHICIRTLTGIYFPVTEKLLSVKQNTAVFRATSEFHCTGIAGICRSYHRLCNQTKQIVVRQRSVELRNAVGGRGCPERLIRRLS